MLRKADSPAVTDPTSGVSNWIAKLATLAPAVGSGISTASIGASVAFSIASALGSTGSSMISEGSGRSRPSLSARI